MSHSPFLALVAFFFGATMAHASQPSTDAALTQTLAQAVFSCAVQPTSINPATGNPSLGAIRSRCGKAVRISADRIEVTLPNGEDFTVLIRESELSDGGDLVDVYIQYDSREDQEHLIAQNVLAFGDPALALLLIGGQDPEALPKVAE